MCALKRMCVGWPILYVSGLIIHRLHAIDEVDLKALKSVAQKYFTDVDLTAVGLGPVSLMPDYSVCFFLRD